VKQVKPGKKKQANESYGIGKGGKSFPKDWSDTITKIPDNALQRKRHGN